MNTEKQMVRVRFAPSPTGYLHIGSFRTALFNWLFARHNNGTFLVRIEDTDIERSKQEYTDAIADALAWINIKADEPVIVQSERFDEHTQLINELLDKGLAYKDFYTQEEFLELHKQKTGTDEFARAFRVCRGQDQTQNKPYVVRFKLPLDRKEICFEDAIRGKVCFDIEQLDDFVLARPDGRPMYNFVVVADDIFQRVTHVIRGEDHISNTPKQILLYEALGALLPTFAHLPLILGKSGNRLSKRDAATAVMDYKQQGYLPEALLNYLVRLGWSHGDQEIFSRQELIDLFDLTAVGKKGSIFDIEKLDWLNGVYMREADNERLLAIIREIKPDFDRLVPEHALAFIALYKERAKTCAELAQAIIDVHVAPTAYEEDACEKWVDDTTASALDDLVALLEHVASFEDAAIKDVIVGYAKEKGKKLGAIAQPIRIALVGGCSSPSVFELLALLGKKESLARLNKFVSFLNERA